MVEEIDKGAAQLLLLKEINEAANRGVALDEILQSAVDGVGKIFDYVACDLFLLEDEHTLRLVAVATTSKLRRTLEKYTGLTIIGLKVPLFEGSHFKESLDEKKAIISDDMVKVFSDFTDDKHLKKLAPGVAKIVGFDTIISVPLVSNEKALGTLGVGKKGKISTEDVVALELFASHLAGIAERVQMEDELRFAKENLEVKVEERTKELKASEEKYSTLVEQGNDGIVIIQDGVLKFINPMVSELTGFSALEVMGSAFMDFVASEFKELVLKRYKKRLKGEQVPSRYEIEILSNDGRNIPVEISASLIEYLGRPADMGIIRDITERKKAEVALRESEEKFRSLSEQSPNIIFINKRGKLAYVNPMAEEIMGYTREEFLDKDFDFMTLIAPESRDLVKKNFKIHAKGSEIPSQEYPLITKNGEKIIGLHTTKLIDYEGETAILGIITDITERKRAEEELAKHRFHLEELVTDRTKELSDARDSLVSLVEELTDATHELEAANLKLLETDHLKSVFLATMSHELRTPLNSIIGFSGLMLQGLSGELEGEQKKQLGIVYSNAKYLLSLIEDLLDLSTIEAGRVDIQAEKFYLAEVVDDTVDSFATQFQKKGLRLEKKVDNGLVYTDKKRFKQILMNLVDNAVKFTERGSIIVTASMENNHVIVSVKDSGRGIKKKDIPTIFQSFQRVEPPVDALRDGSGLGLYICKKITDLLGGEIEVKSTYKKGSTFTFKIPSDIET